jgi:hypothetical protein
MANNDGSIRAYAAKSIRHWVAEGRGAVAEEERREIKKLYREMCMEVVMESHQAPMEADVTRGMPCMPRAGTLGRQAGGSPGSSASAGAGVVGPPPGLFPLPPMSDAQVG